MGFIYKITNLLNNKTYIGQTNRSLQKRWKEHSEKSNGAQLLQRAIKKYGLDNFVFEEFAALENPEYLDLMEKFLIKQFGCMAPNGYNLTTGSKVSWQVSEITKEKMKIAHTGKILPKSVCLKISKTKIGKKNPFYGKSHSESFLTKISCKIECIETGQIFKSITEASKAIKTDRACISRHLRFGNKLRCNLSFRRL